MNVFSVIVKTFSDSLKEEHTLCCFARGEVFSGSVLSYLLELLLIRPFVVLGLGMCRWRLCAAGEGRRDSGHEVHRCALWRQTGSLERGLSVLVVVQLDIVFALLLFIHDSVLIRVILLLVPLLVVAARSGGVPVFVGSADLHVWERHSGGRVGNSGGQGASHRRLVVAESQSLLVYLGLYHGAEIFLCLRLSELLLQGQPRCLLPLQVLHDRLELHAAAAGLVGLGAGERAVGGGGGGLERNAAGGRERALLRGDERMVDYQEYFIRLKHMLHQLASLHTARQFSSLTLKWNIKRITCETFHINTEAIEHEKLALSC